MSLGAILLWIAQRGAASGAGDLPNPDAAACGPGNQREMWLINPFNGETLDEHTWRYG